MIRWRVGDRVTLRSCPGHWRIKRLDPSTAWLTGKDSYALMLASLSPCGTIGVNRKELVLDTHSQETLT